MMDKIIKQPIELWFGMSALVAGIIMKDNTLLVMSLILFANARILLEMNSK